MQRLRVILVCNSCGFLELRYVVPAAPRELNLVSFPLPIGWFQRWDDRTGGSVLLCERCAKVISP
ncbi:MAG TPA: hypothetical protein VGM06_02955 [Polyangiaceae bacterium]